MRNLPLLRSLIRHYESWSLRQRLLWLTLVPVFIAFGILAYLGFDQTRATMANLISTQHEQVLSSVEESLALVLDGVIDDAVLFSNNTTLRNLLDVQQELADAPASATATALLNELGEAREGLAVELFGLMGRNSSYEQLVVVDTDGQELLHMLRVDGRGILQLEEGANLQDQSSAPFFTAASVLPRTEVYLSGVMLRRLHNEVVPPEFPVLQVSTPVYRGDRVAAVLMISVNANAFFETVSGTTGREILGDGRALVLLDAAGNYLADTRVVEQLGTPGYEGHLLAQERGTDDLVEQREPELATALWGEDITNVPLADWVASARTFTLSEAMPESPWTLLILEDPALAFAATSTAATTISLISLVVIMGMVWAVRRVGSLVTRPLDEAAHIADRVAGGDLDLRIPVRRDDEIGRLARAINAMTTRLLVNIAALEERFAERTRDLEVASEVARGSVGIRNMDILLRRTVNLIRERFNFYHVQVFLVDGQDARLVASTGEAGQTMLAENWSLPIGSDSVIGQVTAVGREVIALDTADAEVVHRPNVHLPDTRSELALPLLSGEDVIGALDIQSVYPNAFTEEDVRIFKVIADQVAIAVNNARLIAETERQVERAEELNRRLTRSAWDDYLNSQPEQLEVMYHEAGVDAAPSDEDNGSGGNRVAAPIRVRGEVIGMLNVAPPQAESFSSDEITLIDSIAERVSLAVENVRLVAETQQSLQETEQLYQASQAINEASDAQAIVKALAENFDRPHRVLTLNVFGDERAPDGTPLEFVRISSGVPGQADGELNAVTVPNMRDGQVVYQMGDMDRIVTAHTPDELRAINPPAIAQRLIALGIQAMAAFPIHVEGQWLARLVITHTSAYRFTEREVDIFEALAGQIATVLRSRQLFDAVESERQVLQSILAAMPVAVFMIDAQTRRVVSHNEQTTRLLGEDSDFLQLAAAGRLVRVDDGLPYPTEELPVMRALESGEVAFAEDMGLVLPDGVQIDLLGNAAPVLDAQGDVTSVVAVLQDITELRELQSALQDTLRETTAMYESSKAIYAEQELRAIAQTVLVHLAVNLMPVQSYIALVDVDEARTVEAVEIVAAMPELPEQAGRMAQPHGVLNGETIQIIQNVAEHPDLDEATRATLAAQGLGSVFSFPLVAARETIGWLLFGFEGPRDLTPEQERILESLADQGAVALQNARLKLQTEEALNQTMLLYRASREIARASDAQQVLDIFVSFTLPPEATQAYILLLDAQDIQNERLRVAATWTRGARLNTAQVTLLERVLGQSLNMLPLQLLQQDRPALVQDFAAEVAQRPGLAAQYDEVGGAPATLMLLPMFVGERMLGFMQVNFQETFAQSEAALRTYQPLTDQVATAVESQRLLAQTQASLAETERLYHASQAIRESASVQGALVVLQSLVMQYEPAVLDIYLLEDEQLYRAHHWDLEGGAETALNAPADLAHYGEDEVLINRPSAFIESRSQTITDATVFQYLETGGFNAVVSVPMNLRGEPMGRLVMAFATEQRFPQTDRDYISALCDQTTIVIDNWRLVQRTQETLDETRVLYETSSTMVDATDANGVLAAIVTHALPESIDMAQLLVLMGGDWDAPGAAVEVAGHWTRQDDGLSLAGARFSPDQYPAWAQLATDQVQVIEDVNTTDVLGEEERLSYLALNVQSLVYVPLRIGTRPLGVLLLASDTPQRYDERTVRIFASVAELASISLQSANLLEQTQRRARQLQTSAEISRAVTSILDMSQLLPRVVNLIQETFGYDHVQIFLLDDARQQAVLEASTGEAGRKMLSLNWSLEVGSESVIGQVTERAEPVVAFDTAEAQVAHRPNPYLPDTRSEMAVPLRARGRVLGALDVQSNNPGAFTEEDVTVLSSLGDQVAVALDNARLFEETQDYTVLLAEQIHGLEELLDASRSFTTMLNADEILAAAARYIVDLMDVDHCGIVIQDSDGPARLRGEYPDTGSIGVTFDLQSQRWWQEEYRRTGRPVVVESVAETDQFGDDTREQISSLGIEAMVLVPLGVRSDDLLGSIGLDLYSAGRAFKDEDLTLLQLMATQVETAYQNAQLFEAQQQAAQALEDQVHRLETLFSTSQAISASLDPESILQTAVERLQEFLGFDNVSVALYDDELARGTIRASYPNRDYVGLSVLQDGMELARHMAAQRSTLVLEDTGQAPVPASMQATLARYGIHSMIFAPLMSGERIFGSIGLDSHQRRAFSREEINLIQLIATQVATAYDNARLFDASERAARELEEQVARLESLYAASISLTESLDTLDIISTALNSMVEILGIDHGTAFRADPANPEEAVMVARVGSDEPVGMRLYYPSMPYYDTLRTSAMPVIIPDVRESEEMGETGAMLHERGITTMLIAPLLVQNQLLGTFALYMRERREYTPAELTLLQTITAQVSLAYQNAQLFAQTEQRAEEMRFLFQVTRAATASDEMAISMGSAVDLIADALPNDAVMVFLMTPEGDSLERVAAQLQMPDLEPPERFPATGDLLQTVVETRAPLVVPDLDAVAHPGIIAPSLRSAIIAPLLSGEDLMGILTVFKQEANAYGEGESSLMQTLTGSLSAVVQNIRLLEEVRAVNERLREVDQLKSQFLANMSHELRTPLNSIIGFSRVILKGIDGPLTDMQSQDLETIHSNGQHLLRLINDILDQSKIEAGKMELNITWFDMASVVEVARSMSIGLLKDKPVRLNIEAEPDLPQVWGDEIRTRQVLINLLSNAAKFTHEGSITVTAYRTIQEDGEYLQVSVSDTGIGIPADKFGVLFAAFEQVDGSLTRTTGGTGLGLPISKSLIEMQGGELWVESTVNVGSTFSFTIPTFAKQVEGMPREDEDEQDDTGPVDTGPLPDEELPTRKVVFVIDDEVGMHQLYRRYLNKAGYTVEATSDPFKAEELVRLIKPDIILLDVRMPERDGWEVLQRLKDSDETFEIPVIVVSIEEDSERGYRLGAADYIVKPFMEEDLLASIARLEAERARERILIIDDKPDTIRLLVEWLRAADRYDVMTATSGEAGLALIAATPPDLVLLDLNMPDMDGFEVLAAMRADPAMQNVPVLIITAEDALQEQAQQDLKHSGIYDKNDLDEEAFRRSVEDVLSQRSSNGDTD